MGRKELTPQEIETFRRRACEEAVALFETQDEVSLRQLARHMNCSAATPYRYFEHKEDLFMAVRALCFEQFTTYLEEALGLVDDPLERVQQACVLYARYAHAHRAAFRLMFQLGQPDHTNYPMTTRAAIKSWKQVESTVVRAVEMNVLFGDARSIALMLWSATHGVVSLSLSNRLPADQDYPSILTPLIAALCQAHLSEPPSLSNIG